MHCNTQMGYFVLFCEKGTASEETDIHICVSFHRQSKRVWISLIRNTWKFTLFSFRATAMESSHVVGVGADDEKWSGSTGESGWTMYIGSPIHGETDDVDSSSDRTKGNKASLEQHHHDNEEEEEESDDSMASDASSRPISSHERIRPANRLRYADKEGNHDKKHSTKKKKKKKNEEEILLHKADSAASHI